MNFRNILNDIAEQDPEVYERTSPRRDVIKNLGRVATLTALPVALGSLFKQAYGQGSSSAVINALNFALTLEYLESEFYIKAVANFDAYMTAPATAKADVIKIRDHEVAHVAFLRETILRTGGTPVSFVAGDFDFTGGGLFTDVFTNYDLFLAVAQTFEDTGVRAYKGQAGELVSNNDVLQAALQIHSVEARHAAHIRFMRRRAGQAGGSLITGDVKPWITGNQSNIDSTIVQPSYDGEQIVTQADTTLGLSIDIVNINNQITVDGNAASEAFDEPLTKAQIKAIVEPFVIPPLPF